MARDSTDERDTIVVVGDSFVDGAGATDRRGWATLLAESLDRTHDPHVSGHGGDTIQDVLARMNEDVLALDPDLVVLQVGINDSRHRESFETDHEVPPERYERGLREFVSRVREARGPGVGIAVVGTTPVDEGLTRPFKPDKHYVRSASRRFNEIAREVCRDAGVSFVDVFDDFEDRGPDRLLADGVHPNDAGHQLICERVREALSLDRD